MFWPARANCCCGQAVVASMQLVTKDHRHSVLVLPDRIDEFMSVLAGAANIKKNSTPELIN
jgi:hypothetical protein